MLSGLKTLALIGRNQWLIRRLKTSPAFLGKVLRMVDIETHSYCNRTCSFCPNSFLDRRSERRYLPDSLYTKILQELKKLNYAGSLSFVRYMEPLADPIIFERIQQAKGHVPKARLIVNTNGDFFNQDVLKRLDEAGLTELNIARYIDLPRAWSVDRAVKLCESYIARHHLKAARTLCKDSYVSYRVTYHRMDITLYSFNYVQTYNDRGGSLPETVYERRSPCASPFMGLYFDANGECLPCCNMRSDHPEHRPFSYGNISNSSLSELFLSQAAARLRKDLSRFSKPASGPCQSCAYRKVDASPVAQAVWNLFQPAADGV